MNIAAYCRVSTDKADQLNSLEAQKEFFSEYTKRTGDTLVRLYADEGISGTKIKNRKEFLRMMSDAEHGLFDMVVVKDISRFARNTVDLLQNVRKLKALGIETQFLTANMTSMGNSEFVLTIFGALAQEESANTSKRVKFGKKMNAEKGRVPNIVYGYNKTIGDYFNLAINKEESKVVQQIYKWYTEEGYGAAKIANMLNEKGYKTKRNCKWSQNATCRILTNEIYTGKIINGKQEVGDFLTGQRRDKDETEWMVVERPELRIIEDETFEKAQERVKEISDAYFAKEFTKHPPNEKNLLKGKIICGDCGKGMRLSPRTTKSYVYFCGTFSDGINPACSRHKIDQEDVNKAVFAQISNHMRCCIDALRVIRELNARSSGMKKYDVYEKAITRQRRELEKVNRKFSELYGDYSEHLINESEYLTLKQQYLLKSEALKKEIDNLLVSQNLYSKNYKIDEDWENLINKYLKCRKLNKELADAFVDKVQVFEDGRISVNLVYDDCLEELLQVKNKREGDLYE